MKSIKVVCDVGIRIREGNRACRLIPTHHKREPMSPSHIFAGLCGAQRMLAHKQAQPAKSNNEETSECRITVPCDKSNAAAVG